MCLLSNSDAALESFKKLLDIFWKNLSEEEKFNKIQTSIVEMILWNSVMSSSVKLKDHYYLQQVFHFLKHKHAELKKVIMSRKLIILPNALGVL